MEYQNEMIDSITGNLPHITELIATYWANQFVLVSWFSVFARNVYLDPVGYWEK